MMGDPMTTMVAFMASEGLAPLSQMCPPLMKNDAGTDFWEH